jgi:hypothetical protein
MANFLPINVAGVQAAADLVYPQGEYILQVKKAEALPTQSGDGYRFKVESQIVMGPGASADLAGKPVTHSYAISEKSRPFLVRFFQACGVTEQQIASTGGQLDADWIAAKQYVVRIGLRKADNGREYTDVSKERPLNAWTHNQPAGGAQGAAAPQPGMFQQMPGQAPPQQQAAPPQQQQQWQQPPQQQAAPPQQQYQQPPQQAQQFAGQQQLPNPTAPPAMPGNGQQQAAPQQQYAAPGQPQAGFPAPPPPGSQVPGQG